MRKRPPSRFGAALVQECKKRNITQYRLAQLLGRSTRYLNNIEHDRNEPRFTTILLLAQAMGMEPGELVDAAAKLSWAALAEEKQDSGNEQLEMTVGKKKEKKNAWQICRRKPHAFFLIQIMSGFFHSLGCSQVNVKKF